MAAVLLPCVSGGDVKNPYFFKVTGIRVYSFEEAIYHCFHNWKQVEIIDEFASGDFINWVNNELGLSFIASELKKLSRITEFTERFMKFLTIIPYFDEEELLGLKETIKAWENRYEWEKLKERGDYLFREGFPERAFAAYKKALNNDSENIVVLNNLGICLMHTEQYAEASEYLLKAHLLDREDSRVLLNLIESLILSGNYREAEQYLKSFEGQYGDRASVYHYFYGDIYMEQNNLIKAIMHYEKAVEIDGDEYSIFRIADIYIRLRQFDKALLVLQKSDTDAPGFLIKQAEVYKACGNIPAAVKCIERALVKEQSSAKLWALLAMYYRMDYNPEKAEESIMRAVAIQSDSDSDSDKEFVTLEFARIKKAQGKMKDYQELLRKILKGFKKKYRELTIQ